MNRKLSIKNYIAIADWMLELKLNTRELLTYALIYGFSQDGEGYYYGSLEYLSSWLGMSDRTNATRYLKPLADRGLLIKKEGRSKTNQKVCVYMAAADNGPVIDNPDIDYMIIQPWMMQDMHLNGKDLLLYALVHGYSRKESGNICKYSKDYFAKWLQCRKDHVDRQVRQAIMNGLIKEEKDGFIAIVPTEIELTQIDNTPLLEDEIDFTQIDNTYPQTDNTSSPKLTTNNLNLDNLEDNLVLNNNKRNNDKISKEGLSVVVNKDIDTDSLKDFPAEEECFAFKQELDFRLYSAYSKKAKAFDLALFMQKYAANFFRRSAVAFLCNNDGDLSKDDIAAAGTLMVKTVTNRKFEGKGKLISDLSKSECADLLNETFRLFDPKECPSIRRTREAYMIGVLNNILDNKISDS